MGKLSGSAGQGGALAGVVTAAGTALAGVSPLVIVLAFVFVLVVTCLPDCLRHREQTKRRAYEHDERMKALDKSTRSPVADVVSRFGDV
ncbi:hypothetical protein [Amycolatopsis sp. H20-H5]|uniref:hypothetical protein n=1 Tax=Amycolatopsis sp. H20-H5 TaxID=3046309 RepID=UPI002DB7A170|nr:hypothetical protein [Amycolatopsis sp. H20-H5]MEC3979043.1 hypothetical protein [Amycolatopsis sp. H20-H5]